MSFTKLDEGILYSSVMQEDDAVFRVWIVLLAACKFDGISPVSEVFLATITKKPLDEIQRCVMVLESPDPHSRSTDNDGRRIERVSGGFRIFNYPKYRGKSLNDYFREKKEEYRAKQKQTEPDECPEKTPVAPPPPVEEKPEETPKKKKEFVPPTPEEVKAYFFNHGFSEEAAKRFYEGYSVAGWKDSQGKQICVWKQKAQQVWFKPEHKIPPPKNLKEWEERKGIPAPPPDNTATAPTASPIPSPMPMPTPTTRNGKGMQSMGEIFEEGGACGMPE